MSGLLCCRVLFGVGAPTGYSLQGAVARLGSVGRYRVRLLSRRDLGLVAETMSDAGTGAYRFDGLPLPPDHYVALAQDGWSSPANAAVADLLATYGQAGLDLGATGGTIVVSYGAGELRGTVLTDQADRSASIRAYRADTHVWTRSTSADPESGAFRVSGLDPDVLHYLVVLPADPTLRPFFWGPGYPRAPVD